MKSKYGRTRRRSKGPDELVSRVSTTGMQRVRGAFGWGRGVADSVN